VISHALVKKLNEETSIKIYQGLPVMSVTGPMKVVDTLKLVCCFGTDTIVRDVEFLVAAEIDESECIVGRDLIKRIPNLDSDLDAMQGTIQYMRIQVEQMQKLRDNATQKHTKLRYQTVQGDLFTADEKFSLAH